MRFKELRKSCGQTQIALAQKLGIRQSTLAMWETGKSNPRTGDLPKIAKALGVPVDRVIECFIENDKKAE